MDLKLKTADLSSSPDKIWVWAGHDRQLNCVTDRAEDVIVLHKDVGSSEWRISSLGHKQSAVEKAHEALSKILAKKEPVPEPTRQQVSAPVKLRMPFKGVTPP